MRAKSVIWMFAVTCFRVRELASLAISLERSAISFDLRARRAAPMEATRARIDTASATILNRFAGLEFPFLGDLVRLFRRLRFRPLMQDV